MIFNILNGVVFLTTLSLQTLGTQLRILGVLQSLETQLQTIGAHRAQLQTTRHIFLWQIFNPPLSLYRHFPSSQKCKNKNLTFLFIMNCFLLIASPVYPPPSFPSILWYNHTSTPKAYVFLANLQNVNAKLN